MLPALPAVLLMRPRYVEKLWGGTRLRALPAKKRAGHEPPADVRIGESWEVADLPEGCSVVDGGPLHGRTLRDVLDQFGRAIAGERAPVVDGRVRFPILVKILDAADDLSVQVHPDETYARAHPGTFAKDEAWLVVDVEPGARVLHGVKEGVTASAFRRALENGTAHEQLRDVRVSVGDVLRIEPGTMHAVGKGCVLLEVQQPSDTTFRVFDYNRTEANGKKRPLHVDEAMAVARFGKQDAPLIADAQPGHRAITTKHYAMSLARIDANTTSIVEREKGEPAAVFVLEGACDVGDVHVDRGGTALVVAAADDVPVHASAQGATIVVMTPGRGM